MFVQLEHVVRSLTAATPIRLDQMLVLRKVTLLRSFVRFENDYRASVGQLQLHEVCGRLICSHYAASIL